MVGNILCDMLPCNSFWRLPMYGISCNVPAVESLMQTMYAILIIQTALLRCAIRIRLQLDRRM